MRLSLRTLMRLLVVGAVLGVLAPAAPTLAQDKGKVEVWLFDAEGNGISKAQVTAINDKYRSRIQKAKSKKTGKCVFPFLETGPHTFEVDLTEHRILKIDVDSRGDADPDGFQKEYILGPKDSFPPIDIPFTGSYGHCKIEITLVKEAEYRQALRKLRVPAAGEPAAAEADPMAEPVAPAEAAALPSSIVEDDPYEEGRLLAVAGKHQEAIPLFQKKLEDVPDDHTTLYALGRSQIEAGQTFEAEKTLMKLVAVNPAYASGHYYLGRAQAANFKNAAAVQSFRKEIEISPDKMGNLLAHIANAQMQMAKTNPAALDQAKATLEELLVEEPDNAGALSQLADVYRRKGDNAKQEETYRRLAEADPENADVTFFNLGAMAFNAGRREEAAAHFQKALETNPDHAGAHFQLGNCLVGLGQFPEAVTHFQKYLSLEPDGEHAAAAKNMVAQLSK